MKTIGPVQVYEYEFIESRYFTVQGDGHSEFEAQQDAVERFHRLTKSGDLKPHTVSKPRLIKKGNRVR